VNQVQLNAVLWTNANNFVSATAPSLPAAAATEAEAILTSAID